MNPFLIISFLIFFVSCGNEKKFDKNLQAAYLAMGKTTMASQIVCSQTSSSWRKAIYDHETPSGKYCSDFNVALKELFEKYKEVGLLDSISKYKKEMEDATSKLNNPPNSRKDCYNDFIAIIGEVSSFSRMATDPTGSLQSFNNSVHETSENISKKIDQFNIKYSEFLKKDE